MDENKLLEYCLSKTVNNFYYHIAIETKLNCKFNVLCCFRKTKTTQTINLSFCVIFKLQNNTKNYRFESILIISDGKLIILCSFIDDNNLTQNNKFIVLCLFASIKLLRHDNPKNNYHLSDTIIFFCYCVVSFLVSGEKSVTADPYWPYQFIVVIQKPQV